MGYFLQNTGRSYLILERGSTPGTFFRQFPRHRKLISINKRYTGYDDPELNLRWDWNSLLSDDDSLRFTNYSHDYFPAADRLVDYMQDYADRWRLDVRYETHVVSVYKRDGVFHVVDREGNEYTSRVLVVATGCSQPYVPDVPGIEHAEKYTDVSVDPKDFLGQRVLIVGKGNSAFETADNLIGVTELLHLVSPNPLKFAWKTHYVGHLRAVNNNLLDTYQLKSQNALLDATIESIRPVGDRFEVTFRYAARRR